MKMTLWRTLFVSMVLLLLTGLATQPVFADEGDPPARVARLSLVQGKVSFQPAGETQWSEVSVNRTVSTGDRLYADEQSRAELEVGPYAVRLSQTTDLTVANLNDQLMQLGLGQGSIRVTVYELPANNSVEIDTPNGALTLLRAGSYRVDTSADGSATQVTVNAGSLEVTGGGVTQAVQSGQAVHLTGTESIQVSFVSPPQPDEFDNWCAGRDRRIEKYSSGEYVSRSVPGSEDLDEYGRWRNDPEYGPVWYPNNIPPGWVPYRQGRWAWVEPWGWTWVEAEPWGFVPFHYGRWAHLGPLWVWVPGPVVVGPVYAPALVAFVGGPGFSLGTGVGLQAWFPLGPREAFVPWYHYGPTYLREVNVTNVRNVTNITTFTNIRYVNREGATTAVSSEVFRGGLLVGARAVQLTPEQISRAQVVPHPEVTPAAHAVFGGRAMVAPPVRAEKFGATATGPRGLPTITRTAPPTGGTKPVPTGMGHFGPPATPNRVIAKNPPPERNVPFLSREPAMSAHPGRPLEPQQIENLRKGKPAGPMQDKEAISHAAKAPREPAKTKSAPKEELHEQKH
ncbi:MAG: DUF6600 domain-containing protein [Terriglobia bacterium]|jgi:hypothetical protein